MAKNENANSINFGTRWRPDYRYRSDKFESISLSGFKSTEDSLTDKESYRLTLASLRGQLASGSGSPTVGQYSIPSGKQYNPDFDFSYLNRPDITLVELHEFIEERTALLEKYDGDLRLQIQEQVANAQKKAEEMQKAEVLKAEKKSD